MAHGAQDWYTLTWAILAMDFLQLSDTPTTYNTHDGEVPIVDELNELLYFGAPAPAAHKTTHQNGGADEINVAGLSGELADNQKSTFLKLSDTPVSFAGQAAKVASVNGAEDAIEFTSPLTTIWQKVAESNPSGDSYIEFTGLSPTSVYRIVWQLKHSAGGVALYCRPNNHTGADYRVNSHLHTWAGGHSVASSGWVDTINLLYTTLMFSTYPWYGELTWGTVSGAVDDYVFRHWAFGQGADNDPHFVNNIAILTSVSAPGVESIRIYPSAGGITGTLVLYEWYK